MSTILVYVDAVPGRLYPLVPALLELRAGPAVAPGEPDATPSLAAASAR